MKKIELTPMNIYLAAAIELIPHDELMALIWEFDKSAEHPTVSLLNELFITYDHDFADPFAKLALEAAESPEAKETVRKVAKRLNKATGSTANAGTTTTSTIDPQKGLDWFTNISNFILEGVGKVTGLMGTINGTGSKEIDLQIAALNAQAEQEKTTRTIIGWSIGGLVLLMLFFFMYKMFSNH